MKYNIFNPIHKVLRAMLYDTSLTIQQTNFVDTEEVDATILKIEQTLSFLQLHVFHKSEFIHPLIKKYQSDIIKFFSNQYADCEFVTNKVKLAIHAFDNVITASEKMQKGRKILLAFEALVSFKLNLFAKEENVLNIFLWNNYKDEELIQIEQNIIASLPIDVLKVESKWMIKALNNKEIESWLKGVQRSASESVFKTLLSLAEKELPHQRFEKLLRSLTVPELV